MTEQHNHDIIKITSDIVAAFISNNPVRSGELSELIAAVHASLAGIAFPKPPAAEPALPAPAVSIKKSVTAEYLICLDDGKKFKSLRRHIAALGMTPDEYRAKWGLPRDYPMVAPGYAAQRSRLAKLAGLGNNRRKAAVAVDELSPANDTASPSEDAGEAQPKRRRRPKKAA